MYGSFSTMRPGSFDIHGIGVKLGSDEGYEDGFQDGNRDGTKDDSSLGFK